MRILLIKTSSLGDVIHNLPVVADIRSRFPAAAIDWAVEEALVEIPRLHPGVRRVLPVAWRRWRRSMLAQDSWRALRSMRAALREEPYDFVIDSQGLLKSALLARMARGRRCGYDAASAREPLAAAFYDATFAVPTDRHAVERNRCLVARALGCEIATPPDYGIAFARPHGGTAGATPAAASAAEYAVLLTATSRDDKLWPEARWQAVGRALRDRGLVCRLAGGTPSERERAARIAAGIPDAVALPALGLRELAGQLTGAKLVIGVDTGLAHLAAALGRPTIALFCASDPGLTGVMAATPMTANLGGRDAPPEVADVVAAADALL